MFFLLCLLPALGQSLYLQARGGQYLSYPSYPTFPMGPSYLPRLAGSYPQGLAATYPVPARSFQSQPAGSYLSQPAGSYQVPADTYLLPAVSRPTFSYNFGPGYHHQWRNSFPGYPTTSLAQVKDQQQDKTQERFVNRPEPSNRIPLVRQEVLEINNKFRDSPAFPSGSVQASQPVFKLAPFKNSKVSSHLSSLQTRAGTRSQAQPGVLVL